MQTNFIYNNIDEKEILKTYYKENIEGTLVKHINNRAQWDFNIDTIEPLQYAEYSIGGKYNWHVDQHYVPYSDKRVRKISFSIFITPLFHTHS